jgi:hypothetical protein
MTRQTYSSDLLDVFLKGIHEILPAYQVQAFFGGTENQSGSLETAVEIAIKEMGVQSANGVFFKSGAAAFKHLVRKNGKAIGIDSLDFRLQPQRKRLTDGLERLVRLLESWQAAVFFIKRSGDAVEVIVNTNEEAFSFTNKHVWLDFLAGLIQEYLYWAGGGKQYPFEIKSDKSSDALVICFQLLPVD